MRKKTAKIYFLAKTALFFILFAGLSTEIPAEKLTQTGAGVAAAFPVDRPFRIALKIKSKENSLLNKPAECQINFTSYLRQFNIKQSFESSSLKVVEADSTGKLLDTSLVFQFDKDPDYNAGSKASGSLFFIVKGKTSPGVFRYYHVYFDTLEKKYQMPVFTSNLKIEDNFMQAGQKSFRITAGSSTYYFHKEGAGFASMIDKEGKDWINFNTNSADAQYRGIPNMGVCAHPGFPIPGDSGTLGSVSTIVSSGPLRIKIRSVTSDNRWEFTWDFFPGFARMELLRNSGNYWFLAEIVPNGKMDLETGYSVRNTGVRAPLSVEWKQGVLPSPKWVYFGDKATQRVMYAAMHETDLHNDLYRPYRAYQDPNNMTVFGFGRQDPVKPNGRLLDKAPAHFTIGFAEDTSYAEVASVILSNISTPEIIQSYDPPSIDIPKSPVLVSPASNASGISTAVTLSWKSSDGASFYHLQVADTSSFSRTITDTSGVKDTTFNIKNLSEGKKNFWRVRAGNTAGFSPYSPSGTFITEIKAPSSLSAKLSPPDNIELKWVSNSSAAAGFTVERRSGTDSYKTLASAAPNISVYVDTQAASGVLYYYRVKAFNGITASAYSNEVKFTAVTSQNDKPSAVTEYELVQNWPNPFNAQTTIAYSLAAPSHVQLKVFNMIGQEITVLVDKMQNQGRYNVHFNASHLPAGFYIYSLQAGSYRSSRKLLLLK